MRFAWTLVLFISGMVSLAQAQEKTFDNPDSGTPQMVLFPNHQGVSGKNDSATALNYLQENWQRFGLESSASNLKLKSQTESLLGSHFTFSQMLNGIEIEGAAVIVSIDKSGSIFRVYNNTFPNAKAQVLPAKAVMDAHMAMELGWEHLSVLGKLSAEPKAELCYFPTKEGFKLVHRVQLKVDEPLGDWRIAVDVITGEIHHLQNRHIYHKNGQAELAPQMAPGYDGRIQDFAEELARFREEQALERLKERQGKRADGRGLVFDPDPRTTLLDDTLADNSPASAFEAAYIERDLLGISNNGGVWSLSGPWVRMTNLSPPNTDPSTTADGVWNYKRGNFGFNEATTYFHIDRSQRELQAMGFTNLQAAPILVDVNALNNADNSLFSSPNELWFGAGCVDDSEDADVILHEYGHAIQYAINPSFFGQAHEGAMGEGFGDYWASSYSISRPNGYEFFPSKMFSWDGHFDCWNGRATDKFDLIYTHSRATYEPHESISGGISDELWSTPLFQSLLELYRQGIPRSEVDRIVIEAQFGLGIGQKMRLAAEAIVQTASLLYPEGPHSSVFREYFANHGIIEQGRSQFRYLAAHVPPNRSATDWKNEILISNPNSVNAQVQVTVYEDSNGTFSQFSQESITVEPGKVFTYIPGGTQQRWVSFESDQPLGGTSFFMRRPSDEVGTERAGVPLIGETERARDLILPHVPADRITFWSGAVVLNPNDTSVSLSIQLIGANGSDLSNLLNPGVPTQLAARQKWVTFISEGPGGAAGIFNDSNSPEKVSYVRFVASNEIGAFELYGFNSNTGAVATSGIVALPDQQRTFYSIRVGTANSDYSSFSILNPTDEETTAEVKVYSVTNTLLDQRMVSIPGRGKHLGINSKGGNFSYPLGGSNALSIPGDNVAWMTIEADAPLRIFELSGDNARTTLDGAAVLGATTRVAFQQPKGQLQIFQGMHPGQVTVSTRLQGSATPTSQDYSLEAGNSLSIDIPANVEAIEVTGALFSANVIDNDLATGALTIVKGKQIELGQSQGKFSTVVVDDYPNSIASAAPIPTNTTTNGRIDFSGDQDVFSFQVESSGTLSLFTTGGTDTQGILYNSNGVQISGDPFDMDIDDGGEGLNFRIDSNVSTGTHYILVRGYQDTTGSYTLNINPPSSPKRKIKDTPINPSAPVRETSTQQALKHD